MRRGISLRRRIIATLTAVFVMIPMFGSNVHADELTAINEVNFPDVNFRNYVSTNIDLNSNGVLDVLEIANCTRIDCDNMSISSLQGIEYFTDVTDISCAHNQITSLDLHQNALLQYIDCEYNSINSLNVSGLKYLYSIACSHNQLTSMNLSGNTNLRKIWCADNQLTSLNTGNLVKLTYISCGNNQIENLDFSTNISLTVLYASHNNISSINFGSISGITDIDLFDNNLTTIDLSNFTNLHELEIGENNLTSLDLRNNSTLLRVFCNRNNLTSLNIGPSNSLSYLDCSDNNLISLDVSGNTKLSTLYCYNNSINSLTVGSTSISKLLCYNNNLETLNISSLTKLETLVCYGNNISSISNSSSSFNLLIADHDTGVNSASSLSSRLRGRFNSTAATVNADWQDFLYYKYGLSVNSDYSIYSNASLRISANSLEMYSLNFANDDSAALILVNSVEDPASSLPAEYNFTRILENEIDFNVQSDINPEDAIAIAENEFGSCPVGLGVIYQTSGSFYKYVSFDSRHNWTVNTTLLTVSDVMSRIENGETWYIVGTTNSASNFSWSEITIEVDSFTLNPDVKESTALALASINFPDAVAGDTVIFGSFGNFYALLQMNDSGEWNSMMCSLDMEDIYESIFNGDKWFVIGDVTIQASETAASRFAGRLYTCALNRPAEEAGKSYWTSQLELGASASAIAHDFLFSSEIIDSGIDNSEWITRVYKTFMDRTPSASEVEYWLSTISNGATREDIYNGFVNSPEWISLCEEAGINPGSSSAPVVDPVVAFATRLYTTCLGREGDESGINYWTNELRAGNATGTGAAHSFFFCEEFTSANYSDTEFVARLYRTFMDRVGSEADVNYWVSLLSSGVDREVIFNGFATSPEFATRCAEAGIHV